MDLIDAVCRDGDDAVTRFARWLKVEPKPDDWHRFALGANWDFVPPELFQWIVMQEACDRATALAFFWKSQPEYYLQYDGDRSRVRGAELDGFDLIRLIRERWVAGDYRRSEFAFEREIDAWPVDFTELESQFGARVDTEMPRSMRINLPGLRLSCVECIDGIPKTFWPRDLW